MPTTSPLAPKRTVMHAKTPKIMAIADVRWRDHRSEMKPDPMEIGNLVRATSAKSVAAIPSEMPFETRMGTMWAMRVSCAVRRSPSDTPSSQ